MEPHTILALLLSGAIGGSLGLPGVGGSILAVPVLVYVAGIEAKKSVPMSLVIVGSTSLFVTATFVGEHFARRVPAARLRQSFAYFVLIVAVLLIVANYRGIF